MCLDLARLPNDPVLLQRAVRDLAEVLERSARGSSYSFYKGKDEVMAKPVEPGMGQPESSSAQ